MDHNRTHDAGLGASAGHSGSAGSASHHHGPPPDEWELREAIENGASAAAIKALVERGAQLEQPDALGRTPLHSAVISGHEDIVALLCDLGANIEARDLSARTPLGYAAQGGKVRCTRLRSAVLQRAHAPQAHSTTALAGPLGRSALESRRPQGRARWTARVARRPRGGARAR